jgi:hypothetical protein
MKYEEEDDDDDDDDLEDFNYENYIKKKRGSTKFSYQKNLPSLPGQTMNPSLIKFLQKKNKYINLFGYNFWVGDIEKDPFKRTDFIGTIQRIFWGSWFWLSLIMLISIIFYSILSFLDPSNPLKIYWLSLEIVKYDPGVRKHLGDHLSFFTNNSSVFPIFKLYTKSIMLPMTYGKRIRYYVKGEKEIAIIIADAYSYKGSCYIYNLWVYIPKKKRYLFLISKGIDVPVEERLMDTESNTILVIIILLYFI